MEYRRFSKINEKISKVGLGTWQFSETWGVLDYNIAKSIIEKAHEKGINIIDTASIYGRGKSEEFIGKALKELKIRDDFFIATKIHGDFLGNRDIFKAVERCLERLQVNCIDLMQVHWPPIWHNFPTKEYIRNLEKLINLGKIRYIGLSDFPVELIEAARSYLAKHDIVSIQARYNVIEREAEKELIPYAEKNGLMFLAWSPLAKGAISGKYKIEDLNKFTDLRLNDPLFHPENYKEILRLINVINELSKKYNKTNSQISLNWLINSSETVIPIPGAKNPEQVVENTEAVGWNLSYEDWRLIDEVSKSLNITYVTW